MPSEVTLELPDGARVSDALAELSGLAEGLPLVMAVNREYAAEDQLLDPGDELALIPPVSGGEAAVPHVRVTAEPLSLDSLVERVRDPRAGAVVTFQGVTREVERLEYEAYTEMAEEQIAAIVAEAIERHGLCAAAAEHRVGDVPLGEPSVAVAVSAPHRARGVRGRARDHRPHQGRGADLEEGDRGWRGTLGRGNTPGAEAAAARAAVGRRARAAAGRRAARAGGGRGRARGDRGRRARRWRRAGPATCR